METKRDHARRLIREGKIKEPLRIVKHFDMIYSQDEIRVLQIAYECMTGKEDFYMQIGEDTNNIKLIAINLLQKMIN